MHPIPILATFSHISGRPKDIREFMIVFLKDKELLIHYDIIPFEIGSVQTTCCNIKNTNCYKINNNMPIELGIKILQRGPIYLMESFLTW